MSKNLRAVIYTRVSGGKQVEGTSLESQLEACQQKAAQLGAVVVGKHKDAGVSGGLYAARPGMQAALQQLEAGEADMLITAKLDRYSRDREHQSAIKKRVQAAGARLIFCDMDFADTPEGDLAFGIMGSFAEYERKVIKDRTTKGRRKRAQEGQQPSRAMRPYGYHIVTKNDVLLGCNPPQLLGTYQLIETEAQVARAIYEQCAQGASLRQIAIWLCRNNIRTPRCGQYWRSSTLTRLLANPVYKGTPAFGRTRRIHDETRARQGHKLLFTTASTAPDNWVTMQAPAIIDTATWNLCQERLQENKRLYSGNPRHKHLLTGLLKCPHCNRNLIGRTTTKKDRASGTGTRKFYCCRDAFPSNNPAGRVCTPTSYGGKPTESLVLQAIQTIAHDPQQLEFAICAYRSQQATSPILDETPRLEGRLRELQAKEAATIRAQISGVQAGADPAIYDSILGEIAAERVTLQEQLKRITASRPVEAHPHLQRDSQILAEAIAAVDEAFNAPDDEVTPAEKHDLLCKVVDNIYPDGNGFRLALKPFGTPSPTVAFVL